ncbi:MAG: tRNA 2-thiouridine(34) synthase MnmA [Gammaproteobacteria bacterium]|nr:MAG: tRNA 2-thiouridine(34) synthase MnmA [Gammaproteobacteria bacterium]
MNSSEENKNTRIIVGMSGGVDSSVAALLLIEQGYEVHGLFMKNWEDDDTDSYCSASEDRHDAKLVCQELEIPLHNANFAKEYKENVFAYFLREYEAGRTPNPDILCNREIKFKSFLNYAERLGAKYIATGHYVRRRNNPDGSFSLLKGLDDNKDQSYFLHAINQYQLSKSLFPVGELDKPEVRQIAEDNGFDNFDKKDSTGICFIGERDFKDFLNKYLPTKPGEMKTPDGEVIGKHDGLSFYTLGQRKGLKIGGQKDALEEPWYVVAKDLKTNTLIVAQGHDHPLLLSPGLEAVDLHWISGKCPGKKFICCAKTRYRQPDQKCEVTIMDSGKYQVRFETRQRAVTPGQSVVFYVEDECLGGGIIDRPLTNVELLA